LKFIIDQKPFLEGIQLASRAITGNDPVLSSIYIEANDRLMLTGSDTEKTIKTSIDARITERGTALLPAKTLADVVKRIKGDVEVSMGAGKLDITAGSAKFEILTINEEYPVQAIEEKEFILRIEKEKLHALINKGGIATAKDGYRAILNAVYLDFNGLKVVSTDGHRMALYEDGTEGPDKNFIIPVKSIMLLTNFDTVDVYTTGKQIMFESDETTLTSSLVAGSYLPYEKIIPTEFVCEIEVEKDNLLPALERARVCSDTCVKFVVDDYLNIFAQGPEVGKMEEEVTATIKGKGIEVQFNPVYLIEGLRAMDVGSMEIKLSGTNSAALITDNENFNYIIMPIVTREPSTL